jgi:hypothetical protein
MPWSYQIDVARKLVYTTVTGAITPAEANAFFETIRNDPAFDPHFSELLDVSNSDGSQFSTAKVRESANRSLYVSPSRRAILVGDDLSFGLGRLYGTHVDLNGGPIVNVFRKREEALRWLGVSGEPSASGAR